MSRNKGLLLLFSIYLIQFLFSCGKNEEVLEITAIDLQADIEGSEFNASNGFQFKLETSERVIAFQQNNWGIPKAYAQIDPDTYVRCPIDTNSFDLRLNHLIVYQNDTLEANTNLLNHAAFREQLYFWQLSRSGTTFFGFRNQNEFLNHLSSLDTIYSISLHCQTTDGRQFYDELSFRLNF